MGGAASYTPREDASIVIVGGGYAGITLAGHLQKTGHMQLVSSEECFFHKVGALRSCVQPDFASKIFIPFKKTFGDTFVQGRVVKINKESNFVTLDSGEELSYTHLVLATGMKGSFPWEVSLDYPKVSRDDGVELYKDINNEIKKAETIVCVGGGAVGVELAGEIKTDFSDKNVILIHSNKILCTSRLKPSAQAKLNDALRKKGVQLILGDKVINFTELQFNKCVKNQVVRTETGKEIKADLVFRCIGSTPATDPFKEALGEAVTNEGRIKVDEFLIVKGTENIFAIGDITDIEEEKMAVTAAAQADTVAKNITAALTGGKMHAYNSGNFMMVIPVGRDGGVSQVFGIVSGDFLTKTVKSKGLFASKFWDQMKQKLPTTN